jgi:purine-binding chemotaxis protein CheW
MNTTLTNYQNPLQTVNQESWVKLLLFSLGSLNLALPIDCVKKVVNYTPVYGSGLSAFGVANIDNKELTVIDLYKKLFKVSQSQISGQKGYLIIVLNSLGEYFGIWVQETPTLQDIVLSQLRVLPESYRRSDTLAIASHVMVIPQENNSKTVFLLDVDQLLDNFK